MSWQDDYQIDGGKRVGGRIVIVFLITAVTYHHHYKDDAEGVSNTTRNQIDVFRP